MPQFPNLPTPSLPTPHGDKLRALTTNTKVPAADEPRVRQALDHYQEWREDILNIQGERNNIVSQLVTKLNEYKRYIDLELIYDSPHDWLYRQKGQTKIDSSIIEEFLPVLVLATFRTALSRDIFEIGPTKCFSNMRFDSTFSKQVKGAGATVKSKDQDFAISRPVFIRTSHFRDFRESATNESHLAYVAAECKTNLDKTMFQEAAATARDVKAALPGAKYFLLCEWLDMTPISTSVTPIDEIILLRKAKRLGSHLRKHFSKAKERKAHRQSFVDYIDEYPFVESSFERFLDHVARVLNASQLTAVGALTQGYF